ncbi:uncharacterized mitochondrial protein-like protein [Tanacetum coccineum]
MYGVDLKNIVPMNKLVKENLVRGLPSKLFTNDQTCAACQKGKQHKASSTKDETSGILKSLITGIENLVDHKGILRQFSVARTPQQNGVAERRNRTLIEAARTMLADSKLPTTFWAEAVNTACYVPFGCPVTILNTIDHLGKFDGKADEGFFVRYSLNSKAFRVFNSRTRIVEENLHIRYTQSNGFTDPKSSHDDGSKPSSDDGKKVDEYLRKDSECNDQEKEDNRLTLKNLDTTIQVSPNPTTRIHKDHHLDQVIGDFTIWTTSSPRAWYETLSTYLLDNGFQRGKIDKTLFIKRHKGDIMMVYVYVDDIIFGLTKKELCFAFKKLMHEKFQMSSIGELTLFLGLRVKQKKDGIFISQDKYVEEILKKFRFTEVNIARHKWNSKLASRMKMVKKWMFILLCACDRYQSIKGLHLHVMKRIFRYLKGQPKLGLWYPKDFPFDLVAYTDSDYAGASLNRKSTSGGCQFSCCRLIFMDSARNRQWLQILQQKLNFGTSVCKNSDEIMNDNLSFKNVSFESFSMFKTVRENHDLRRQVAEERHERLELTDRVGKMERRQEFGGE